jgi:hypothetical protein
MAVVFDKEKPRRGDILMSQLPNGEVVITTNTNHHRLNYVDQAITFMRTRRMNYRIDTTGKLVVQRLYDQLEAQQFAHWLDTLLNGSGPVRTLS